MKYRVQILDKDYAGAVVEEFAVDIPDREHLVRYLNEYVGYGETFTFEEAEKDKAYFGPYRQTIFDYYMKHGML